MDGSFLESREVRGDGFILICSIAIRARPWPTCGCFHVSFCITSIDASNICDGMKFLWNMLTWFVFFSWFGNWHFTSSKNVQQTVDSFGYTVLPTG